MLLTLKKRELPTENKHALEFGLEYEQRIDNGYAINPEGLWPVMRNRVASFANEGIILDRSNPILIIDQQHIPLSEYDGVNPVFNAFLDTITYGLTRSGEQSNFDKNFRSTFGYGDTDFVEVDAVNPDDLSIEMLSADELYDNGNSGVAYAYGYDIYGNRLNSNPSFEDFWKAKDAKR